MGMFRELFREAGPGFTVAWVFAVLISLAFWALVAWGVWEGIQWLQRN